MLSSLKWAPRVVRFNVFWNNWFREVKWVIWLVSIQQRCWVVAKWCVWDITIYEVVTPINWFYLVMLRCMCWIIILIWIMHMIWGILWMIRITRWWVGKKSHIFYENQKNLVSNSNKLHRCLRKKLEMFVIRVNQMGNLVNSKPCNTCIYYMQLYGIKSVYYSNEDGVIVKEKLNDITADHLSISQNKYYKFKSNMNSKIQ